MNEEEFKSAIQNMLMMQNNNDRNFEILQRQIDNLQKQLNDLNDFKEILRLPKKGDIVLFPSFVHHLIMPHKDPIDRYSLAFNVHPTGHYGARDSTINVSILK